ncbi:MAG: choice-of-anchor J domain-containing protein [Bacteroidota bacterium]
MVHIIHFGENIGVGRNISEAQIISQIDVLNEDFRRMNADAANTPTIFQPVASDTEIEFELAQRDPEGLATTGINRVNGGKSSWLLVDNYELKTLSNWPSEDYMNIWVTALADNFLGYAQFPVSDIGGLETASRSAITDGIVVDYRAFGSVAKDEDAVLDPRYDLGRTTTHEVGHYLGLRHIWGDGGCGVDDFCADTPASSNSNLNLSNCSFPGPSRCGSDDMFQNYMDFTDDICMNLFTEDQKTRIRAVMDNSPRRVSLANSLGAEPPVVAANDLGIRNILSPLKTSCDDVVVPTLEVRNYGTNLITSAEIQSSIAGVVQNSTTLSLDLDPLELATVELPQLTLNTAMSNDIDFLITTTNGTSDGNGQNNTADISVMVPEDFFGPILLDFSEIPSNWTIENDDELITWELRSAPNGEPGNQALFVEFYNHENQGDLDVFTSPVLDFSQGVSTLSFDVAYAQFPNIDTESLKVVITENCIDPLTGGDVIYERIGANLSTAPTTSGFFVPSGSDEWRTEVVDLSAYVGRDNIRISFVSTNDFGNNLYIDNINLLSLPIPGIDLISLQSPSIVSSNISPEIIAEVKNSGAVGLTSFETKYVLDDNDTITVSINSNIDVGQSALFSASIGELEIGTHRLYFSVANPNDTIDFNQSNNSQVLFFEVNLLEDFAPFKESFTSQTTNWTAGNPDNDVTWVIEDGVASIDLSIYETVGERDWLVSPNIDLSQANQATLNFDYSYSQVNLRDDGLTVLISSDGGTNYQSTSFDEIGEDLKSVTFGSGRTEFENISIPLDDFLGETDVRIAFVSTNDNGDAIVVDNIQVFTTDFFLESDDPIFPNPTFDGRFNLKFELDQREDVNIVLYDALGHFILETTLPNTINQTYTFNIADRAQGLYFIQVQGETFGYVRRVLKNN